jgi:hypothetical protein
MMLKSSRKRLAETLLRQEDAPRRPRRARKQVQFSLTPPREMQGAPLTTPDMTESEKEAVHSQVWYSVSA